MKPFAMTSYIGVVCAETVTDRLESEAWTSPYRGTRRMSPPGRLPRPPLRHLPGSRPPCETHRKRCRRRPTHGRPPGGGWELRVPPCLACPIIDQVRIAREGIPGPGPRKIGPGGGARRWRQEWQRVRIARFYYTGRCRSMPGDDVGWC
jgi:hypothetical protein